jgi:hypothetical protein
VNVRSGVFSTVDGGVSGSSKSSGPRDEYGGISLLKEAKAIRRIPKSKARDDPIESIRQFGE